MKKPSLKNIPDGFDVLNWLMQKIAFIAASIVVVLFIIGVFDLAVLIVDRFQTGDIRDVTTVIDLIEFVLLLFIVVEVYRTIAAYAQNEKPKYVLTLVVYTGIIAVIRRVLVFNPEDIADAGDALMVSAGFAILLLSLGVMLFIVDQFGSPMDKKNLLNTYSPVKSEDKSTDESNKDTDEDADKDTDEDVNGQDNKSD